jgi:hypothetical protein
VTSAAQWLAAWWIADANLLDGAGMPDDMRLSSLIGIYAIGILASLPVMFVPLHVLLEQVPPGAAFAASWQAFVLNTLPLLAYAGASLVLLAFGLATMGLGLVLALPLWVASTYAAWKDIFGNPRCARSMTPRRQGAGRRARSPHPPALRLGRGAAIRRYSVLRSSKCPAPDRRSMPRS